MRSVGQLFGELLCLIQVRTGAHVGPEGLPYPAPGAPDTPTRSPGDGSRGGQALGAGCSHGVDAFSGVPQRGRQCLTNGPTALGVWRWPWSRLPNRTPARVSPYTWTPVHSRFGVQRHILRIEAQRVRDRHAFPFWGAVTTWLFGPAGRVTHRPDNHPRARGEGGKGSPALDVSRSDQKLGSVKPDPLMMLFAFGYLAKVKAKYPHTIRRTWRLPDRTS